ncbi:MAG: hemolysin family protein, partial [Anaerovoracaceae bacterium]
LSLILVVFFLFMNAFFVVAEFSLVRVRKSQLQIAEEEGKSGVKAALRIVNNVNAYLSACQLGITLASLALGWLGEPAVSELIKPGLAMFGLSDEAISAIAVALGFALVTALHIVLGELIPKSLAIFSTDRYARLTAGPLVWFYRLTAPVMWLFNAVTNGVMKLLGHDIAKEQEVYTGEEIQLLIDESTESGLIDPKQKEFVDNIFTLYSKDVYSIMTPRTDLECFDLELPYSQNIEMIKRCQHTRYPVCRGDKDHIEGFINIKDLYWNDEKIRDKYYDNLPVREITAVSETISVQRLLQIMEDKEIKFVLVVDEYGGTAGIVTSSDITDQIVGSIDDEYVQNEDSDVVPLSFDSFLIDASIPVSEVTELIGFVPENAGECETAAGLLLNIFDRIPKTGDKISVEYKNTKATFTVLAMEKHRIEKISVKIEKHQVDDKAYETLS